jgi:hypothetical protein
MAMTLTKLQRLTLCALLITAVSIGLALLAGPSRHPHANYLKLCSWDCGWYESIVKAGYHSVVPPVAQDSNKSNVAFFPGYPLFARALYLLFGQTDARPPLLAVAHFFCVAFWLSFLLLLDRFRVDRSLQALAVLAVFAHPAGFFLVTGYSESLFMASMLFYFYFADAENPRDRWAAALPGFLMTATRIVGLPVAAYPVFKWALAQKRSAIDWRGFVQPLTLAAISSLGSLLFFAYCQLKFGDYKLYMETQAIGWGIATDYGALWKWREFRYMLPYEQISTIAAGAGLAALWIAELFRSWLTATRLALRRVPLLICTFFIFYITICGLKSLWFRSMIRYTLPIWVLLLLCLLDWVGSWPPRRIVIAVGAGALATFYAWCEFPYLVDFLNSRWFA